jgi:hypothetical protein
MASQSPGYNLNRKTEEAIDKKPNSKSTLDIKNFAPKSEGYSDKIQIFFQHFGRFSKILKFCGEISWECLASELRLNAKTIAFLFSFVQNVVRDDQFQFLDLRHLHFFNSTHPNV